MSTKIISKILIVVLCVTLAVSICSCTDAMKQVNNIKNFATDVVSVAQSITDESIPVEEKLANAEKLLHPSSGLTLESIQEDLANNEVLQDLDVSGGVNIVEMPDISNLMSIMVPDENGNCTCTTEVILEVGGTVIKVDVTLLSDDFGMGIAGYSITRE